MRAARCAELKDNINTMIDNLRLTTDRNTEQDWLKTNLARFTNMLQGQRDLQTVGRLLLSRADAAGQRPARRHLSGRKRRDARACGCSSAYADDGATRPSARACESAKA